MKTVKIISQIYIAVSFMYSLAACNTTTGRVEIVPVEIAPNKVIIIERQDFGVEYNTGKHEELIDKSSKDYGTIKLRFEWHGKTIQWQESCIPISLREYYGELFLIGFDSLTDPKKSQFRYYAQKGSCFEEIDRSLYPNFIAIQNMWHLNQKPEEIQATLALDPSDLNFRKSLTAEIWYAQCYEMIKKDDDKWYLEAYKKEFIQNTTEYIEEDGHTFQTTHIVFLDKPISSSFSGGNKIEASLEINYSYQKTPFRIKLLRDDGIVINPHCDLTGLDYYINKYAQKRNVVVIQLRKVDYDKFYKEDKKRIDALKEYLHSKGFKEIIFNQGWN